MMELDQEEQLAHAKSLAGILEWLHDNPEPNVRALVFMAVDSSGVVFYIASGVAAIVAGGLSQGLKRAIAEVEARNA